jgi:enamine deaminase RidA (YjgF/YER057c/UK114 family)
MAIQLLNPSDLLKPPGFSHGAIGSGRLLFISGQVGTDRDGNLVSDDLVAQFDRALGCVVRVAQEAGGKPEDIIKINLLILDVKEYRRKLRELGVAYRKHLGRYFPSITLAEVKGLFREGAKVEIEAIAILPE